jgi:hypothetical protein
MPDDFSAMLTAHLPLSRQSDRRRPRKTEGFAMTQFGIPAAALRHDRSAGTWCLDPGFCLQSGLLSVTEAAGQAQLHDAEGGLLAEGLLAAAPPITLEDGDATIRLDPLEIDGQRWLYLCSAPLDPGRPYRETRPLWQGARAATPEDIAQLPALGAGTMIATEDGPQPIDWLRPGDRLHTRDHGFQPLLWVGQHVMPRRAPAQTLPLHLPGDGFGPGQPSDPLLASPGLGVLLAGPELELWFAEAEMLARLDQLAPSATPAEGRQVLYSLVLEQPGLVLAGGIWVTTVHPDPAYLALLPDRVRGALGPVLLHPPPRAARPWLTAWEVAMLHRHSPAETCRLAA